MNLCVVMPAFNECEGIQEFLLEIEEIFRGNIQIIVVDDFSTDGTFEELQELSSRIHLKVIRNTKNLGHGPSTLLALKAGLELGSEAIIAVDGDGQFSAVQMFELYNFFKSGHFDVVEGVRQTRLGEPWFRSIVSYFTRQFVKLKSSAMPQDANTPLRIYNRPQLVKLTASINRTSLTPNLMISIICRVSHLSIGEFPVTFFPRKGASPIGDSWKQRFQIVPSWRFLKFCIRSTFQILRFTPQRI